MKNLLHIFLTSGIFLFPVVFYGQLQWSKTGQFPNEINIIYFIDSLNGFVNVGTAPGGPSLSPVLFRTSDGGKTWILSSVELLDGSYGLQDIIMSDSLDGWACGSCNTGYSIWKTIDGGWNWNVSGARDNRFSVAIRKSREGIVVSDFYNGHARLSKDGGTTFNDVFQPPNSDNLLGLDFTDDLHGVLITSFRSGNVWNFTTDGGLTWFPSNLNTESWSVYAQKGTTNFFASPEGWSNGPASTPSPIYRSTDFGTTWNTAYKFTERMTGSMNGVRNILYCQTQYPQGSTSGIYRSQDSGMSWKFLGGPNGYGDTRFAIIPRSCNTNIIYAADEKYIVYKAYDTVSTDVGTSSLEFLSSRIINDSLNITIHLPIYFHHTGTVSDVDMIMHYPTGSLKYLTGVTYNGKSIDLAGSAWPGRAGLHFSSTDLNTAPDSLIGYANFLWSPYEYACDEIDFDSIQTQMEPCSGIAEAMPFHGIIGSFKTSEISSVAVNEIIPEAWFTFYPNPAENSITIESSSAAKIELFDLLGRRILNHLPSEQKVTLDVSSIPSGPYILRIESNGIASSKSIIIAH